MAEPSVRNIFIGSTDLDPTQVNENFNGFVEDITDGTKDITINALTAKGTATFVGTTLNIDAVSPVWEFGAATTWTVNDITDLDLTACEKISLGGSGITSSSVPDANTLYPNNLPKAFAKIEVVAGPSFAVNGGFNVSAVTVGAASEKFVVSYHTALDTANYGSVVGLGGIGQTFVAGASNVLGLTPSESDDSNTVTYLCWDEVGAAASADVVGNKFHIVVFGNQ